MYRPGLRVVSGWVLRPVLSELTLGCSTSYNSAGCGARFYCAVSQLTDQTSQLFLSRNSARTATAAPLSLLASSITSRQYATSRDPGLQRLARAEERRKQLSKLNQKQEATDGVVTSTEVQVVEPEPTPATDLQAQQYTVYDQDGRVVALMAEDQSGIADAVGRQVLRGRRNFTATVFSADGTQIIFRVRRPAYLVTSTMFIEDGQGQAIGEVHARWHPLRRKYDLYIGKRQYATISEVMLAWQFELKDSNGGTMAVIDRNFSGFAKELFTDAGQYGIHFGYSASDAAQRATQIVRERSGKPDAPAVPAVQLPEAPASSSSSSSSGSAISSSSSSAVIPIVTGQQLVVSRPLGLSERMVALACAISIDYDYFSRHAGGGIMAPPLFMPYPGGGGGGVEGGAEAPPAPAGAAPPTPPPLEGMDGAPGAESMPSGGDSMPSGGEPQWRDDQEIRWDDGTSGGQDGGDGGGLLGGDGEGEGGSGGIIGTVAGVLGAIFGGGSS